eukprot:68158-Amphidinium_carterae.1
MPNSVWVGACESLKSFSEWPGHYNFAAWANLLELYCLPPLKLFCSRSVPWASPLFRWGRDKALWQKT